jgi:cell division protein FtsA
MEVNKKKKLDDIVSKKLSDIFNLVEAHLKKIGRSNLLPAGIVLTGGGSLIETIEETAKESLKLPSKIATLNFVSGTKSGQLKDPSWSVAYGLSILGLENDDESVISIKKDSDFSKTISGWFKKLLP